MKMTIYTDGGARGNPGPAGIGGVLIDEDKQKKYTFGKYIGNTTNNQAEYRALLYALTEAKKLRAQEVSCFLDSELVVKQLNREYRVKDPDLGQLFLQVWNIAKEFKHIRFTHVRREKNKEADAMVNKAIDEAI